MLSDMLSYLRPDVLSLLLPVAVYGTIWLGVRHEALNPRDRSGECINCQSEMKDGECPCCDGSRIPGDW